MAVLQVENIREQTELCKLYTDWFNSLCNIVSLFLLIYFTIWLQSSLSTYIHRKYTNENRIFKNTQSLPMCDQCIKTDVKALDFVVLALCLNIQVYVKRIKMNVLSFWLDASIVNYLLALKKKVGDSSWEISTQHGYNLGVNRESNL